MLPDPSIPAAVSPSKEDRTWAMVVHLSAFAGHLFPLAHLIVPLVIWLLKRDLSAFMDDQGKEAVNAQISLTIYAAICIPLCFVLIGIPLLGVLWVVGIVLVISAAIAANEGRVYRYPYILRLVR